MKSKISEASAASYRVSNPDLKMKHYSEKEYHQRSLMESGFGSLKRKRGGSVSGKSIKSMKTEIYCKAIAHNLSLRERFSTEPVLAALLKMS